MPGSLHDGIGEAAAVTVAPGTASLGLSLRLFHDREGFYIKKRSKSFAIMKCRSLVCFVGD
jgi:hypothetical protein